MTEDPRSTQLQPDPSKRLADLVAACIEASGQGDGAMVEALLRGDPSLADAARAQLANLERVGLLAPPAASDATSAIAPQQIGPYRILAEIGAGGMGTVYRAEQREPVRRMVALKVVRAGMATRDVLARFALERRALAAMNHRCIAKVLDAGATPRGEPYFVMELVEGLPFTTYCDRHRLALAERLTLFQLVCQGVHHAHQKGVVHRDLKPGNVLVVREDNDAVPKILDFGLAKATNRDFLEATFFTEKDRILGTPEYMSPEQAAGLGEAVDARSDVYALGVMLYELLTGELPFPTEQLRRAGRHEALRIIQEVEPPRPSTKITAQRAVSPPGTPSRNPQGAPHSRTDVPALAAAWGRALKGDLDWIVMRAMAKEPERRYDSATALAADLHRFLDHEPVSAGPPGAGYRLRKLLRRYRAQAIAAVLLALALVLGIAGTSIGFARAVENATIAEANARTAAARADEIARQKAEIDRQRQALATRQERFDMLAHIVHLRTARQREASLHPASPATLPHLRAWLATDAQRVCSALPALRETVRAVANPRSAGNAADSDGFLHDTLRDLVRDIESFAQKEVVSVTRRIAWAERVTDLTVGRHAERWSRARRAILRADGTEASALYRDAALDLAPQLGLVPIGMNPATKLWEFYDLRSAWDPAAGIESAAALAIPTHDAAGHVAVGEDTGIVFVLIPGGTFLMGAQAHDPDGPNYDVDAHTNDSPVHEVSLAPFFLARHELTQGQWYRLSEGAMPSTYGRGYSNAGVPTAVTFAHPVEMVDAHTFDTVVRHAGLVLPTEAQWEFACRAGTTTAWSTGSDGSSLEGSANVLDQRSHAHLAAGWVGDRAPWDDGFLVHSPAGALRPNGWGLHDVHGNVLEITRDWFAPYALAVAPGDGGRPVEPIRQTARVVRGGAYDMDVRQARSAARFALAPTVRHPQVGARAARVIEPP